MYAHLCAGVRGTIMNRRSEPIAGALLTIYNRTAGFKTNQLGEFWRVLLPGSYVLLVCTGFQYLHVLCDKYISCTHFL